MNQAFPAANPALPATVAILGLGLLGASLAEALKRRGGIRIAGISSPRALAACREAGLIDAGYGYEEAAAALEGAEIVILCTPIEHILSTLEGWKSARPRFAPGAVVTDVGSTKEAICRAGAAAGAVCGFTFVGGHPMAGSEKTGVEARDVHLFENAAWVLCPEEEPLPAGSGAAPASTAESAGEPRTAVADAGAEEPENAPRRMAVRKVQALAEATGARTAFLSPALHDKVAARVSHLPQLLSTCLASLVTKESEILEQGLRMAGGGFRDMTRIAASSFSIWEPILKTNAAEIEAALAAFAAHWEEVRRAQAQISSRPVARPGGEAAALPDLGALFRAGNGLRSRLQTRNKGFRQPLAEILVYLEDRPGALSALLRPLAARDLNISDLEILKVREGEEGTLMMGFRRPEDAEAALTCLREAGFRARLRT